MFNKSIALFSATILLAACNSVAQPKPAQPQSAPAAQSAAPAPAPIRQAWRLTELSGFKGEIPTNAKMDWTKLPNAYAYMGNHMNFHAQASKSGSLKLSEMTSTIMLCENNQLEDAFTTAMKRVSRYEINGQTLILRGKNGVLMKFAPAQ